MGGDSKCVEWTGLKWSQGRYGMDRLGGRCMGAHRAAWIRANGNIPEGMVVCHKCDNGLCVNIDHLFLGTRSDNMRDAASKNRLPNIRNQKGESNRRAIYTKEFAEEVRRFYLENKVSFSVLAKQFGLKSKGHAHAIVRNRIWA